MDFLFYKILIMLEIHKNQNNYILLLVKLIQGNQCYIKYQINSL